MANDDDTANSNESFKEILGLLQKLYDEAPEDVKKHIPNVFTLVHIVISAGVEIYHIHQADKVANNADNATCTQEFDVLQGQANKILLFGLTSNAISLAVECYRLKQFWGTVKDARNMVAESEMKVPEITKRFEEVLASIAELDKFVADMKECTMVEFMDFTEKKDKIKDALADLKTDIAELKYNIDGSLVQLKLRRNEQTLSSVTGGFAGTMSFFSTLTLFEVGNPWLLGINLTLAASRVLLAVGGAVLIIISKDDIEKLEKELDVINQLECRRNEIDKVFRAKLEEHGKALRTLTKKMK